MIKTFEEFQWNKLNPFKKKKVVPPLNPRDEIDPYHEENWDEVVAPEPVRQPMMNVDPFGEEDWGNDDEPLIRPIPLAGRYREPEDDDIMRQYMDYRLMLQRGERLVARWPLDIPRRRGDETDLLLATFQDRVTWDNNCPSVTFSDYYTGRTFTCPKCGKVSRITREHGDAYQCGRCDLKTRNFGNCLHICE